MTRTLLVVSGGAEAVPGIRLAKRMGLHVVVSDGSAAAPGLAEADDSLIASTYDVAATIAAATEYSRTVRRLDGVMCIAADVPVTVASVAAALGLPGIPLEAARLAADKIAMKERLSDQGIPVPWFTAVASAEALRDIVADRGLPLVIKPVDSRGARGVLRLVDGAKLEWSFEHARSWSPTSRVMVEEYLPGAQLSTESLLLDGVGQTPGFCDRNYEFLERFSPWIIENGGEQPSVLSDADQQAVASLAERAGAALGISTGIVKGDMVLTPSGPKVIEVAARLSGGWFSTDQIPLATGVDLVGAAIRVAVGDPISGEDLTPAYQRGVAIRYFFPEPGRVTEISGSEPFADVPWVHRLGFAVGVGDIVRAATDHTLRAGYVDHLGRDARRSCGACVRRSEQRANRDGRGMTLRLYTVFHLNIAYSSIDEDRWPDVIDHCYRPLLDMARDMDLPFGIEASVYTLEAAKATDRPMVRGLPRDGVRRPVRVHRQRLRPGDRPARAGRRQRGKPPTRELGIRAHARCSSRDRTRQ